MRIRVRKASRASVGYVGGVEVGKDWTEVDDDAGAEALGYARGEVLVYEAFDHYDEGEQPNSGDTTE